MRRFRIAAMVAAVAMIGAFAIPANATITTEGCTPGYWKNHTTMGDWPPGYYPSQDFTSVLELTDEQIALVGLKEPYSMLQALQGGGGSGLNGAAKILLRAAAAGFLNAASGMEYGPGRNDIRAELHEVWGDRAAMLAFYERLDYLNNSGCPLSGGEFAV